MKSDLKIHETVLAKEGLSSTEGAMLQRLVTCGCGNPTRYSHFRDGVEVMSCNKHIVCPTYDELIERSKLCFRYENALRQIVNVNAMDYEYRTWAKTALNM